MECDMKKYNQEQSVHSASKHNSVSVLPGAFTLCCVGLQKRSTLSENTVSQQH